MRACINLFLLTADNVHFTNTRLMLEMIISICVIIQVTISLVSSSSDCNLSAVLKSEIRSYEKEVQAIEQLVVDEHGLFRNLTWTKLANFVDDFGTRLSGTQNLEDAIDFLADEFVNFGLDNVHTENVSVAHWVRNKEFAILEKPKGSMALSMLGLGGSIGTPKAGLKAAVMVVKSFEELMQRSEEVPGKIVVFNPDFVGYHETVQYRFSGADEASKYGAVAVLIRSIAPFSIGSPHTGIMAYKENVKPIPAACISIENAEMLDRMHRRGIPLQVHLFMGARNLPSTITRNLVAEIQGHSSPEKVVIVSGHIDSWDVGQGAMDGGGGAFISWMSLAVLRQLNLRPKRTIRAVLWTAEEQGFVGAKSYFNDHKSEIDDFTLVMESDGGGTFSPYGLAFFGSNKASCIVEEVLRLMTPFNATALVRSTKPVESDIRIFQNHGVPGIGIRTENERFFWFHHTEGDSMTVEDPSSLDRCTALFAASAFIIADLGIELPRTTTQNFQDPTNRKEKT